MKKKLILAVFSFYALIMFSCPGRNPPLIIIPETSNKKIEIDCSIGIDNITETMNGKGKTAIPEWLMTYNNGGIDAVEKMDQYAGKYCFVGRNKNSNFEALLKWAENYPQTNAITGLAAARIENRLNLNIALYPDDEYGVFYERLIKKSYDMEYPDAVTEEIFWIKKTETTEANSRHDTYEFFAFVVIDKTVMQEIIKKLIADSRDEDDFPTRAQNNAINNIQQRFFEGF
jgi:hypothetical protein